MKWGKGKFSVAVTGIKNLGMGFNLTSEDRLEMKDGIISGVFGIHAKRNGGVSLTHIPTGNRIGGPYKSIYQAAWVAEQISGLAPWESITRSSVIPEEARIKYFSILRCAPVDGMELPAS